MGRKKSPIRSEALSFFFRLPTASTWCVCVCDHFQQTEYQRSTGLNRENRIFPMMPLGTNFAREKKIPTLRVNFTAEVQYFRNKLCRQKKNPDSIWASEFPIYLQNTVFVLPLFHFGSPQTHSSRSLQRLVDPPPQNTPKLFLTTSTLAWTHFYFGSSGQCSIYLNLEVETNF